MELHTEVVSHAVEQRGHKIDLREFVGAKAGESQRASLWASQTADRQLAPCAAMSAAARANSTVASHTSHSSLFPRPFHLPQPPLIAPPHISAQHFLYLQQQQRRLQLVQSLPIPQPLLHQSSVSAGSAAAAVPPAVSEARLPAPAYDYATHGAVMTPEQVEALRRQIAVYSTICQQLVAMHQALTAQHAHFTAAAAAAGVLGHLPFPYDHYGVGSAAIAAHPKTRQRWTPQPAQLQILEKYFSLSTGTPNKARIREITAELQQHGPISETNVYNWFQNRKARAKRKNSNLANGGSGGGEKDAGGGEAAGAVAAHGAGGKGSAGTGWGSQGEKRHKSDSSERVKDVTVEGEMVLVRSGSVASSGGGDVSKDPDGRATHEAGEGSPGGVSAAGGSAGAAGGTFASAGEGGGNHTAEGQERGAGSGGEGAVSMGEAAAGAGGASGGVLMETQQAAVAVGGGAMAVGDGANAAAPVAEGSLPQYGGEGCVAAEFESVQMETGLLGDAIAAMRTSAATAAAASAAAAAAAAATVAEGGLGSGDGDNGAGMDMGDSANQGGWQAAGEGALQQVGAQVHADTHVRQQQRLDAPGEAASAAHVDAHVRMDGCGTMDMQHARTGDGAHLGGSGGLTGAHAHMEGEAQSHMRAPSCEHVRAWGAHGAGEGVEARGLGMGGHGMAESQGVLGGERCVEGRSAVEEGVSRIAGDHVQPASLAAAAAPENTPGETPGHGDFNGGSHSLVQESLRPQGDASGGMRHESEAGIGEQRELGGVPCGQAQVVIQQAGQGESMAGQQQEVEQRAQQEQQLPGVEHDSVLAPPLACTLAAVHTAESSVHAQDDLQQQQQQQQLAGSPPQVMVPAQQQGEEGGQMEGLEAGGVVTGQAGQDGQEGLTIDAGGGTAAAAAGGGEAVMDGGESAGAALGFTGVGAVGMGSEVGAEAQEQQHMLIDQTMFHPPPPPPEATSAMQVMINGKPWDVPIGLLDVRNSFGEGAVIFDAQGCAVPTNEMGITLEPLQEGSSYTVQGGDIALVSDPVSLLPDDDLVPDSTLL
ncbi:unnamed protein product [Closterium sp. Yama58-4]|nr:unnamed protein product [Closterium sp. Yama58-4]